MTLAPIVAAIGWVLFALPALAIDLRVDAYQAEEAVRGSRADSVSRPDLLPQSRVAVGVLDIRAAWLADATELYAHGVLGDAKEAMSLSVETKDGRTIRYTLPEGRVFEDLEPRLVDLDKNGTDELLIVETDFKLGASLAVYGIQDGRLAKITQTAYLGRPYRWLNPLGAGDFDGDRNLDLAVVETPHIGGILRLYRYFAGTLAPFAEYPGVSTHRIGSTELGKGAVARIGARDLIILPDQSQSAIMALQWTGKEIREVARASLPDRIASSLNAVPSSGSDDSRWIARLDNGTMVSITLRK